MSLFRQGVIAAFVLATILNAWVLTGAMGGYKYYGNVMPLDAAGAQQFALWIEVGLVILAVLAWWFSAPKNQQP